MVKIQDATRVGFKLLTRLIGFWLALAVISTLTIAFTGSAFAQTEVESELSSHDKEKLRALVILMSQKPEQIDRDPNGEEQALIDFFEVWGDNVFHMTRKEALEKYRQAVKRRPTPISETRLKIFTEAVRHDDEINGSALLIGVDEHSYDTSYSIFDIFSDKQRSEMDVTNKIYVHLLEADLHLLRGGYREAWASYGEVLYLTSNHMNLDPNILMEISSLELVLYALEGNYSKALESAVLRFSTGISSGRNFDRLTSIHNTVTALTSASKFNEAESLTDILLQSIIDAPMTDRFYANLLVGRNKIDLQKYEESMPYLLDAVKYADTPRKKSFSLQRLFTAYASLGQYEKASDYLNEFNQLFEANPSWVKSPATLLNLAQGEYFMALELSDFAVKLAQDKLYAQKIAYERHKQNRIRQFGTYKTEAFELMLARQKEDYSRASSREIQAEFVNKAILFISIPFLLVLATLLFLTRRNALKVKAAQTRAETAARVKGQFLNLIGHNTRNSLSAIESMVQALKSSSVSLEHLPTVQVIGSQATTLNKSITDLIFSARMISGDRQIKLSTFNAYAYKSQMLPVWTQKIGKRNVQINFNITPDLPLFLVDPLYLQTAVEHLVEEAIPKTRVGSIDIDFALQQSLRGQMLRVTVEDTGDGLTEANQDAIDEFFEVDETGISIVDFEQTIGYSMSRSAVEAMGGTLALTSEIEKGTRASFAVPIKSAAANDVGKLKDRDLRSKDVL